MTTATAPSGSIELPEECRRCRAAKSIGRIALFALVGVAFSFGAAWFIALFPVVGVFLGVLGVLLMLRTLITLFTTTSPRRALMSLGISTGVGFVVSAAVGFVVRLVG